MNSPKLLPPDVGVVVVAAGQGARVGGETPKQFRLLGGVPVLLHALRPFTSHPAIGSVVVVLAPEYAASPPSWLAELAEDRLRIVAGGEERSDSVRAGVRALPETATLVLVHDGSRPFPPREVIDGVIEACREGVGAIAAIPVHDTIKEAMAGSDGRVLVARTVPRKGLWRAQTPQGFPRTLLEAAAAADLREITDDAQAVERLGAEVRLIPDSSLNLKITTPEDLTLAEALLGHLR